MRLILFLRIVGSLAAVLYNDYLNVGKESGVIPSNRNEQVADSASREIQLMKTIA